MVYNQETVEVAGQTFVVTKNVLFETIPSKLIQLLGLDLLTYYRHAPFMNVSCWNVNLVDENKIIRATSWGNFFPLEEILYIHRLVIDPKYQHSLMLHTLVDKILEYGEAVGARKAIMISDKFDAWCRLIKPKGELSKARVIEREIRHD